MRRLPFTRTMTFTLVCTMGLLPTATARAAGPIGTPVATSVAEAQETPIRDIELGADGELGGQLLDAQGQPQVGQQVVLAGADGAVISQTTTDEQGNFLFTGVRSGLYLVQTADSLEVCRCWVANTAPPVAEREVLLVAGQVNRGQRPFYHVLANPLVIGVLIAAAIAIPIAVHNARQDRPSGS